MKVRNVLGLAVAVPALVVALAQPGSASAAGVVTFGGTFQITPTSLPEEQALAVCFFGVGKACENGAESTGAGAGAAATTAPVGADAIDGVQAAGTYVETCAPGTVLQPVMTVPLEARVHDAVSDTWSDGFGAVWIRAGLVAVITGGANGAALVTPASVPVCDAPVTLAVSGAAQFSY